MQHSAGVNQNSRPRIVGHRGASSTNRENTIEAFLAVSEIGADGVELDVRRSSDDVLIVHHDAHLSDGRLLRDCMADDLPDYVPTLAAALEACGDLWVNIEIKNHPDEADYDAEHGVSVAVAGLVAAFEMNDRVMISAFDFDSVLRIRSLDPTIPIAWLVWGQSDPQSLIERAKAHSFNAIHPSDRVVDANFVKMANAAGLEVNVWTVDDPDRIRQLSEFGVNGIVTNDPAAGLKALGVS